METNDMTNQLTPHERLTRDNASRNAHKCYRPEFAVGLMNKDFHLISETALAVLTACT